MPGSSRCCDEPTSAGADKARLPPLPDALLGGTARGCPTIPPDAHERGHTLHGEQESDREGAAIGDSDSRTQKAKTSQDPLGPR